MGTYTDFLEARAYDILPDDDHYIEKLMEVVNTFRPFDEALDIFIADQGYTGALSDIEEKVSFLTSKFNQSGIKTPRNIRKWFTEHKRIERKTAYQICFAFLRGEIVAGYVRIFERSHICCEKYCGRGQENT